MQFSHYYHYIIFSLCFKFIFETKNSFQKRLLLAACIMRLVSQWDSIPAFDHSRAQTETISSLKEYDVKAATAFIYGDFDAKQFGVDSRGRVRLVDVDAREWVPYAPKRNGAFASDRKCSSDDDCQVCFCNWQREFSFCWLFLLFAKSDNVCQQIYQQFGIDRRLEKGKRPLPFDFGCDSPRGVCRGLDGRTNVFAACAILVTPLLETFYTPQDSREEAMVHSVADLLSKCLKLNPTERASASALQLAFRELAASDYDGNESDDDDESHPQLLPLQSRLTSQELEEKLQQIRKSIKKQREL